MLNGWLIYRKEDAATNHSYILWFIEEASKQQIDLELILREDLIIGIENWKKQMKLKKQPITRLPDFAVVRTREPLLNCHLEALGIPVFNPANVSAICNNKAVTHHYISQFNIPMADTFYFPKDLLPDLPPISFPFVLKEVDGHGGKQVYYIENERQWQHSAEKIQSDTIIQPANVQLGKDLRVFVIGKEIVGAVLRASDKDFRANYTLGGTAAWYELNSGERKLVQKIIESMDFGLVGIDFLFDSEGGLLFNEIEDVVGSRTLSQVSDINLLEKYVSFIKQNVKRSSDI